MELADLGAARRVGVTGPWLALCAVILLAGAAQRITGLGFGLIAMPAALLVLGSQAVPFIALIGALSSVIALASTWRLLQPRAIVVLCVATVAVMVPALFATQWLSEAVSYILAGSFVVVATILAGVRVSGAARHVVVSPIAAGALTGISAALAGLAGPAAAAHGMARSWGESFVPNLQAVLLVTVPFVVVGHGWPSSVPLPLLLAAVAGVGVGAVAGGALQHRIRPAVARFLTRCLALTGGVVALCTGISAL